MDVYILKSCDTCRKALKWLAAENIEASIHDIRSDGISQKTIAAAVSSLGWETVLNRRSTSWRALNDDQKQDMDADKAIALIAENPTLMKRPLFISGQDFVAGFDKTAQEKLKNLIS